MAKALTRPRGRRRKASDNRERELRRLRLAVCDDTGFRLYLATYDQPKRRDELIALVIRETEAEKVRITRLDLAEAGPESNLVGLLRTHLQQTDLPPGWRQAVMVTGIEQRLDYSSGREGFAFLHQANLLRDALPDAAPVPVVLWLSRLASAVLPAEGPDLWHWRAANFDFTGDEAPRVELLRELTSVRLEDDLWLPAEQRFARIVMLKELLAKLERDGLPKSKRQAAERAHVLLELGIEELHLGHAAKAITQFETALEVFRAIGDRRGSADALGNLGNAWSDLGEPQRAIEYYRQVLQIMRAIGDRRGQGVTLGNIGLAYAALSEPQLAIEYFEQSLAIAREIGDRREEGSALADLAGAHTDLGNVWRAIDHYEQALSTAREIGDANAESWALDGLGLVYAALGESRRAIEYFEQSVATARETGNRQQEGRVLGELGNAYYSSGEAQRAIEYHDQALAIACEIGDRRGEGNTLFNSALVLDQLGERREALRRMEQALRVYEQIGAKQHAEDAQTQLSEWQGKDIGGEQLE